jgi:hypothetical protein
MASTELSNITAFQLEMDSSSSQSSRWYNADSGSLTDSMKILKEIVTEALDSGVFYANDLFLFVDAKLGRFINDEQRSYRLDRVDGGHWGMEIYLAKGHVERTKAIKASNALFEKARTIQLGTLYKNISIFMQGKRYNFTTLQLTSLDAERQTLTFIAKRRGVKGTATLTLGVATFFGVLDDADRTNKTAPPISLAKDTKTMNLF